MKADHTSIPWVTYTDPELAHVGETEAEARERHMKINVLRWHFAENDRAQAERETEGVIKVVTDSHARVLGATIVGAHAGELILPWVLAKTHALKLSAMAGVVAPYPTFSEVGKRVAGSTTRRRFSARKRECWCVFSACSGKLPPDPTARTEPMRATAERNGIAEGRLARLARPLRESLSRRLLVLTLLFVMLAEVLIFVPSIANFRLTWLEQRLAAAQIASLALEARPDNMVSPALREELLKNAQVYAVALHRDDARRLVLSEDMPPMVDTSFDLRDAMAVFQIMRCLSKRFSRATVASSSSPGIRALRPVSRSRSSSMKRRCAMRCCATARTSSCFRWLSPSLPPASCSPRFISSLCARCAVSPKTWSPSATIRRMRGASSRPPAGADEIGIAEREPR